MYSPHMNGPVPIRLSGTDASVSVWLSTIFRYSKRSNTAGRGWSEVSSTVYLSGVSMLLNQVLIATNWPTPVFGVFDAIQRELHVLAGELTAGVELNPLAEVQFRL